MVVLCATILFVTGKYHLFKLHRVKHSFSRHSHWRRLHCGQNNSNVRVHPHSNMLYHKVFEIRDNHVSHLLTLVREGSGGTGGGIGELR